MTRAILLCIFLQIISQVSIGQLEEPYSKRAGELYAEGKYREALLYCDSALSRSPGDSTSWHLKGQIKQSLGAFNEAIEAFTKAIEINPSYKTAYRNRGVCFAQKGDNQKAMQDFKKAIEIDPAYKEAYNGRGIINQRLGEYQSALADFNKAIELDPNYTFAYNNRGMLWRSLKDYPRAQQDYTKALALDPKYPEAYNNRGLLFLEILKDYPKAWSDFNKVIDLAPAYKYAYLNRGRLHHALKQYEQAKLDYDKDISIDPQYKEAYYHRGLNYYDLKEQQKELADYNRAVQLDSAYADALLSRAEAYTDAGKYEEAISDCNALIRLRPGYAAAYRQRGIIYKELKKDAVHAQDEFNKAVELEPGNYINWYNRGVNLIVQERYNEALADLSKVIELDSSHTNAFFNLGICHYELGNLPQSIESYSKAIQLDSLEFMSYNGRGIDYAETGEYARAIQDYNKVIAINPEYPHSYNNRGIILTAQGQYDAAIADFKKAIELRKQQKIVVHRPYINVLVPLFEMGKWEEAATFYDEYKSKGLSEGLEEDANAFRKKYHVACLQYLPARKYKEALRQLQESLTEYSAFINSSANERSKESIKKFAAYIHSRMGYTCEQLGSFEESQIYYKKALVINDKMPEVYAGLARVVKKLNTSTSSDNIAPELRILFPKDALKPDPSTSKSLLIARITDPSGIAWVKLDGKAISGLEEDGLLQTNIDVPPGKSEVLLEVSDKMGNRASKLLQVETSRGGETKTNSESSMPNSAGQRYYALLIANENYQDNQISKLKRPMQDVTNLKQALLKNYNFKDQDVIVLGDKSREDILGALSAIVEKMGPQDNLLIFFAGHGAYKTGINKDDVEGYLLPVSARKGQYYTYISASDIITILKGCRARHVLLVTDACYSGSLIRRSATDNIMPGNIEIQYRYNSRQIMASGNLEPVPDNSVFIHYLIKRLEENTDRYITADALFMRFKDAIINNTGGKTLPVCTAMLDVGDEGGQFVFIRK